MSWSSFVEQKDPKGTSEDRWNFLREKGRSWITQNLLPSCQRVCSKQSRNRIAWKTGLTTEDTFLVEEEDSGTRLLNRWFPGWNTKLSTILGSPCPSPWCLFCDLQARGNTELVRLMCGVLGELFRCRMRGSVSPEAASVETSLLEYGQLAHPHPRDLPHSLYFLTTIRGIRRGRSSGDGKRSPNVRRVSTENFFFLGPWNPRGPEVLIYWLRKPTPEEKQTFPEALSNLQYRLTKQTQRVAQSLGLWSTWCFPGWFLDCLPFRWDHIHSQSEPWPYRVHQENGHA